MKYPRGIETGYRKASGMHLTRLVAIKGRWRDAVIILYLVVLGLAIVIFLAIGGRRRKPGIGPPQIDVTKKSDLETRTPGED
jgi:hypothetical protein